MGQAIIKSVLESGVGRYDIELIKDPGKSVARLKAIADRLTVLTDVQHSPPPLIPEADAAYVAAQAAFTAAEVALNMAIEQMKPGGKPEPVVAVPHWSNDGNGTVTGLEVATETKIGTYGLNCVDTVYSPVWAKFYFTGTLSENLGSAIVGTSFGCNEMSFTINHGSVRFETGDSFTIEITEANIDPNVDVTKAQTALVTAMANLAKTKRAANILKTERLKLETEQAMLNTAMAAEPRTGVWCVDKTTNLALNQVVGTVEINTETTTMLLAAGGLVANSVGKVQPVGVSSPSAVFVNLAKLPGIQKWKPTYRVGTIVSIDYDEEKCDVVLDPAYSSQKGLAINQAGEEYPILKAAVTGWTQFCNDNPSFPLVSETEDTDITMSDQLKADMASVNSAVNNKNTYKLDTETYGKLEHWSVMSDGASGDCEDFALTKAKKLVELGYPASAIHIEIGLTVKGVGHAWLIVQTNEGDYALDLGQQNPVLAGTLSYTDRQRQYGSEWKAAGIILRGVSIDYMGTMGVTVFFPPSTGYSGDRVIVNFTDMDWTKPKVIGFLTTPRSTKVNFYLGKTTAPFSSYTRLQVTARTSRYWGCAPSNNLTNLVGGVIKTLVLPCPVRVLSDDELSKIQAFRASGGRVIFFAGSDRAKSNDVLAQLNSPFEVMPTRMNTNIKILSGFYTPGSVPADSGQRQINVGFPAGTYTRLSGSFVNDGFEAGQIIQITGFGQAGNNVSKTIGTVSALVITVTDATGMFTETGTGDERIYQTSAPVQKEPEMFAIPAEVVGWLNLRQSNWSNARLRDSLGFGLNYNSIATTLMYETYFTEPDGGNPFPAVHCIEQKTAIETSPPPTWTVTWYQFANTFPAGYLGAYSTDKALWASWIGSNSDKMPYLRLEDYEYSHPIISTPYGSIWNVEDMMSVDMFGSLMAYAGDNMVVAALKWSYLTDAVGNPVTLDYYFETEEFANWCVDGVLPQHDYFQNGNTFQPWPPYIPSYYTFSGFADGTGVTTVSP